MNRKEHILTCIAEEANEVGQAVGKCLRFGLFDENNHNSFLPNANHLVQEVNDLIALVEVLAEFGYIDASCLNNEKAKTEKKLKYQKYAQYSVDLGLLQIDL